MGVGADLEGTPRPYGGGFDIGAYEFVPVLGVWGMPSDQAINLAWKVNMTLLPAAVTWTVEYVGPPGDQPSPISGLPETTRSIRLTGLKNYVPYTVTVTAVLDGSPYLTDTVIVMPTDITLFLPMLFVKQLPR